MKELQEVYKEECLKKFAVYKWSKRFQEGRDSVEDDPREGRPCRSRSADNVDRVRALIRRDRRLTIRALQDELNVDKETVRQILHDELGMRKLCAKLIPRVLTAEQKQHRVATCQDLLERTEREGTDWMSRIVTGDESWVFEYDPETKRQSAEWVAEGSSRPKKARMSKSKVKSLLICFFDIRGLVHHEYVPQGQTVTGQYYVQVLRRLRLRLQRIRPELAANGWLLHHDNAPAHSALVVQEFLASHNIATVPHSPYSPDLAPLDFYAFPKVKTRLKGHRYSSVEEVQKATTAVLKDVFSQGAQGCFEQWVNRWRRVIELDGEYCERF